MYKQLHNLNGEIVLIDWVGDGPKEEHYIGMAYYNSKVYVHQCNVRKALKSAIPTLPQDKSIWLELSERCGGKLERHKHFDLCIDWCEVKGSFTYAIPTPQSDDLWEEAIKKAHEYAADKCYREELCRRVDYDLEFINYLKQHYHLTRKS